MKYLSIIFLLVSFESLACDKKSDQEPEAFLLMDRYELMSEIGFYFPLEIEGAKAESVLVVLGNDQDKTWKVSIPTKVYDALEIDGNPELSAYGSSYFYAAENQMNDITFSVKYSHPPKKDGAISLCGPIRSYKISELERKNEV